MSRIGKKPISIPMAIEVKIDNNTVEVAGPKGELSRKFRSEINIEIKEREIFVSPREDSKAARELWGTTRAIINNMIIGAGQGFEKKLQLEGVGYKVELQGSDLSLALGFSHLVKVPAPKGITFSVDKNIITVSGIDKVLVGQTASNIRKLKKPEPYKGKGIRYVGEIVKKKLGKKAVASE